MSGTLIIQREFYVYTLEYSYNSDKNEYEVYFLGNGFRFSKDADDFPLSFYFYLEEIVEWTVEMIITFRKTLFSNDWRDNDILLTNGFICKN